MKNIFLIGFMGSGKSSTASALRENHGFEKIIEMDAVLAEQAGMSITEIFAVHGEAHFRRMETDLLKSLSGTEGYVVSCGGGVPLREENVRIMQENGIVVLLTVSPESVLERTAKDHSRPLLQGRKTVAGIAELLMQRIPSYETAAQITVNTDGKKPEEVAAEIAVLASYYQK